MNEINSLSYEQSQLLLRIKNEVITNKNHTNLNDAQFKLISRLKKEIELNSQIKPTT